ncbi:kelch-like protein 17 [Acanthaster planci]|uniref:Kelch-like protein 17 n=1 Tax=Acanthaster planci TaxID=133434 RepID=A0A8B7YAJ3_ACAPL|nr:kelch-like protein 17 [Acanthaster planci]XP_022090243.1 kelch-like protein 17 [Acanthaster planci]XP_022090244.1 kelch-like protein 17 [Acanthaster planci]XP_022090246.1 kelch-like protein 17 [Acanthaster planci]XP_022090247.1 kelch-like protein 17 [Acanthaster planci]
MEVKSELSVQVSHHRSLSRHPASPVISPVGCISQNAKLGEFFTHRASRHANDAFVAMNRMRQQATLCDIVLKVGDKTIMAHKLVLASCSAYFHAMFTSDMSESRQSEVHLRDIEAQAVEQLVQFAYTAEINIGEKNVQSLLPAASLLQLHSVRDACCKFLLGQLDPSNCLGIRRFADMHGCYDLEQSSHLYSLQNFNHVVNTEEYLHLPADEVMQLISSEQLNITSEEDVFNAVVLWVRADMPTRQRYVAKLMERVRLPLLTRDFLVNTVETEPIIRSSPECKDLLIEALKYHLLPEQRAVMQSPRTQERHNSACVPMLFCVGGGSLFAIHSECECYDPRSDTWHPLAPMSSRRARLGVATVGRLVYAVGGYDGSNDLALVESYNPQTNTWKEITPMGTKRSCLAVASLNGLLYAIGGYDGASCLNSVERYDPLTNTWTSVAAMATRRRYVKVAVMDGCLYALGGYDGSCHLSSVERYDPQTNSWAQMPHMISRRSSTAAAVVEGVLYVVGGNDGAACLSSAERFNPDINLWEPVPSMSIRRSTHDAVAMDGQLYVVGGNDGSSSLNSVERYDPKSHHWNTINTMVTRRSSVGVTVTKVVSHLGLNQVKF